MGIYVNPGNTKFRNKLKAKIYVDKSPMISHLNELIDTDDGFVCMSRARRFGKTMMTNICQPTTLRIATAEKYLRI